MVEVALLYRPRLGSEAAAVTIGVTDDVRALRVVRDALVNEARRHALLWKGVDGGLLSLKLAEFEQLCRVLATLLPDGNLRPTFRVVNPGPDGDDG